LVTAINRCSSFLRFEDLSARLFLYEDDMFQAKRVACNTIFVINKPLHPKLAHAFGYRLSLSASVHYQTWAAIATATNRTLLSSCLPVPKVQLTKIPIIIISL